MMWNGDGSLLLNVDKMLALKVENKLTKRDDGKKVIVWYWCWCLVNKKVELNCKISGLVAY